MIWNIYFVFMHIKLDVLENITEYSITISVFKPIKFKFSARIIENNKILDARVCVMKYFKAASEGYNFFLFLSKEIIERRLISRPI